MILTVFITLLAFSLILLFLGRYIDAPPLQLVAYCFIFILGTTLMLGGINYKTGVSYSYICACCEDNQEFRGVNPDCVNGTITLANITDVYTTYSGEIIAGLQLHHLFGLMIAFLASFGFVIVLLNLKSMDEGDAFHDYRKQ